jgi:hypothetical protein
MRTTGAAVESRAQIAVAPVFSRPTHALVLHSPLMRTLLLAAMIFAAASSVTAPARADGACCGELFPVWTSASAFTVAYDVLLVSVDMYYAGQERLLPGAWAWVQLVTGVVNVGFGMAMLGVWLDRVEHGDRDLYLYAAIPSLVFGAWFTAHAVWSLLGGSPPSVGVAFAPRDNGGELIVSGTF